MFSPDLYVFYVRLKCEAAQHARNWLLIREYCERNAMRLAFYRPFQVPGSTVYELRIESARHSEIKEFMQDHELDKLSTPAHDQL